MSVYLRTKRHLTHQKWLKTSGFDTFDFQTCFFYTVFPPTMPNKGPKLTQHSLQNESQMKSFRLVYFCLSKMAQLTPHIAQHWPNLASKMAQKNPQLNPLPVGSCLFLLTRDQSGYVGPLLGMFGGTNGCASSFWMILIDFGGCGWLFGRHVGLAIFKTMHRKNLCKRNGFYAFFPVCCANNGETIVSNDLLSSSFLFSPCLSFFLAVLFHLSMLSEV